MATDLTRFRDHCRKMAVADHRDDCKGQRRSEPVWGFTDDFPGCMYLVKPAGPPTCSGCLPDADRAMFARLAGEVDEYLAREEDAPVAPTVDDVPLFGEAG